MNGMAQVGHVSRKDVRHTWWLLAAAAAIAALVAYGFVTGYAFGPYWTNPSTETLGMPSLFDTVGPLGTVMVSCLAVAVLVQLDSPTRPDAFWASRPIAAWAVLAAKLLLAAVLLILPGLVATLIALRTLDASAGAASTVLVDAGIRYGELLLAAVVVAAVTDGLSAFVSISLIAIVGAALGAGPESPLIPKWLPHTVPAVAVAAAFVLLAIIYRTHTRSLGVRITAVLISAALISAMAMSATSDASAVPTISSGPALKLDIGDPSRWPHFGSAAVTLAAVDAPIGERIEFEHHREVITSSPSTEDHNQHPLPKTDVVAGLLPPVGRPVRWIIDQKRGAAPGLVTFLTGNINAAVLAQGIKSIEFDGRVTVLRPRLFAVIPLRDSAHAERDGRRIAIYGTTHDAYGASVYIHFSGIPRPVPSQLSLELRTQDRLQYAMVNYARGEAMLLEDNGDGTGESGSIVLPWVDLSNSFKRFTTAKLFSTDGAPTTVPLDKAWYDGASLVAVEWTPIGSYRAVAKATRP